MTTHIIPWMNVTVNIIKNAIEVYQGNEKMYEYKGKFIFRILDNNNFVILEKDPSNTLNKCDNHQRVIFFRKDEKGKIIDWEKLSAEAQNKILEEKHARFL